MGRPPSIRRSYGSARCFVQELDGRPPVAEPIRSVGESWIAEPQMGSPTHFADLIERCLLP
jgi:hypothetical protein